MTESFSFGTLRAILNDAFQQLPDPRSGQNTRYRMCDVALAAFSVFFLQCPSFLAYQRDMQRCKGCNNAESLFGIAQIPSDEQIRNLLDPLAPGHLRAPFWALLERLMEDGPVARAFDVDDGWLCSLDGTQYFSSTTLLCPRCTVTQRDETLRYAHTALIPVLVNPDRKEVLALEPEFVVPQDGREKQDCERHAANRWIERNAERFAGRQVTILTDDLHCNQPFCERLLAHDLHFISTCKPESHPTLYEEVTLLDKLGAVTTCEDRVWTGKEYQHWTYRFVERVPLREPPRALHVNWCELTISEEDSEKVLYRNAFATDHPLSEQSVRSTVAAGRSRWKVENEGYNVLKNHGYYLEHNYGHGEQYLSAVIVMLILLAFLCHTGLQLCDQAYQRLRAELGPRRTFFGDLRTLTRYIFFESWDHMMTFMIGGLDLAPG
jgi:hypothetical protein